MKILKIEEVENIPGSKIDREAYSNFDGYKISTKEKDIYIFLYLMNKIAVNFGDIYQATITLKVL